ncbi:MAG: 3-phosphoglycerate dehydrogenase [Clostridia bacterium]|nr:3-phosphoglycerate dehydrogenase [Clostridia bacterium]
MKIKLYNKIAKCGLDMLPATFEVGEEITEENGIVVRSADLHSVEFPAGLTAIARAGAGVNNIPLDVCTEKGITVFNTPGANANAVKELAITALLLSSRRVKAGMDWAETLAGDADAAKKVEKEKSRFVGPELFGKTLGVIGLGAIGGMVANAAAALGMKILGYDPVLSAEAAKALSPAVEKTEELDRIFKESDYITVHVPSLPTTRGILCKKNLEAAKDGVRLLNLARADLAVDEDILELLASGKVASYFTDFPTAALAGKEGVLATPHLGASTPEAEDNCAIMACRQLSDYLLNGNIKNSVNMPCISLPREGEYRVGIFYKAENATEAALSEAVLGANVAKATRKDIGYMLCDSKNPIDLEKINTVGGVIRTISY